MHKYYRYTSAFTIVELLIVIVVIAVLAAISIVAYSGIQRNAYESAVQADLRNVVEKTKLHIVFSDNEQPPEATQAGLENIVQFSKSAYNTRDTISVVYCRDSERFTYIASSRNGQTWVYNSWEGNIKQGGNWGGSSLSGSCQNAATVGTGNGYYGVDGGTFIALKGDGSSSDWLSWIR